MLLAFSLSLFSSCRLSSCQLADKNIRGMMTTNSQELKWVYKVNTPLSMFGAGLQPRALSEAKSEQFGDGNGSQVHGQVQDQNYKTVLIQYSLYCCPSCGNTVVRVWPPVTPVNVHVWASGVRPPAAMDLDTSLETMPPTGGIVTALQATTWNYYTNMRHFTVRVFFNLSSVLQSVRLSTSQEEWHQNPPQQRGQRRPGANQVRFLRGCTALI